MIKYLFSLFYLLYMSHYYISLNTDLYSIVSSYSGYHALFLHFTIYLIFELIIQFQVIDINIYYRLSRISRINYCIKYLLKSLMNAFLFVLMFYMVFSIVFILNNDLSLFIHHYLLIFILYIPMMCLIYYLFNIIQNIIHLILHNSLISFLLTILISIFIYFLCPQSQMANQHEYILLFLEQAFLQ